MPIYEYLCSKCGKKNEVLQKFNDPTPEQCDSCGARKTLNRLVSRSSFQLRGGGWYSDLYASTKKPASDSQVSDAKEQKDAKESKDAKGKDPTPPKESKKESKKAAGGAPPASTPAKTASPSPSPSNPPKKNEKAG